MTKRRNSGLLGGISKKSCIHTLKDDNIPQKYDEIVNSMSQIMSADPLPVSNQEEEEQQQQPINIRDLYESIIDSWTRSQLEQAAKEAVKRIIVLRENNRNKDVELKVNNGEEEEENKVKVKDDDDDVDQIITWKDKTHYWKSDQVSFTIGRRPDLCDFNLLDETVSRLHIILLRYKNSIYIVDLGSREGFTIDTFNREENKMISIHTKNDCENQHSRRIVSMKPGQSYRFQLHKHTIGFNVGECKICFDRQRQVTLRDCGHFILCKECLLALPNKECPVCKVELNVQDKIDPQLQAQCGSFIPKHK